MWLKLFCITVCYRINSPGWDFNLAVTLERAEHVWCASLSSVIHGDVCITTISMKTFSQLSDAVQWSDIMRSTWLIVFSVQLSLSCECLLRMVTDVYTTLEGSSPDARSGEKSNEKQTKKWNVWLSVYILYLLGVKYKSTLEKGLGLDDLYLIGYTVGEKKMQRQFRPWPWLL